MHFFLPSVEKVAQLTPLGPSHKPMQTRLQKSKVAVIQYSDGISNTYCLSYSYSMHDTTINYKKKKMSKDYIKKNDYF